MSWQTLGAVAPDGLVEARLQLHHAAQVVASAGVTFLAAALLDGPPRRREGRLERFVVVGVDASRRALSI